MPESRDPNATGKLDSGGAALAAIGLGGTTYALIEAPEGSLPAVIVTRLIGVAALIGFFVHERRSANPMLPLSIFRSRQFSAANTVTFVVYAALGGACSCSSRSCRSRWATRRSRRARHHCRSPR